MQFCSSQRWLLTGLILAAALVLMISGDQNSVFAAENENVSIFEDWNHRQGLRSAVQEAGTLRVIVQLRVKIQLESFFILLILISLTWNFTTLAHLWLMLVVDFLHPQMQDLSGNMVT